MSETIDLTDPKPRPRCVKCGGTVDRTRHNPGFIVQVCLSCWFEQPIEWPTDCD